MNTLPLDARQILAALDAIAADGRFPTIDGHGYPLDVRLHAFSDGSARWAIVVETLRYTPHLAGVHDVLHVMGNCVWGTEGAVDPYRDVLARIEGFDALVDPRHPDVLAPDVERVRVRGRDLPFSAPRGEALSSAMRTLTKAYRGMFLADESELRQRIPADLTEVLRVDAWNHPDVNKGVRPSSSESFAQLAEVLASADPSRWNPLASANTHWTNWLVADVYHPTAFAAADLAVLAQAAPARASAPAPCSELPPVSVPTQPLALSLPAPAPLSSLFEPAASLTTLFETPAPAALPTAPAAPALDQPMSADELYAAAVSVALSAAFEDADILGVTEYSLPAPTLTPALPVSSVLHRVRDIEGAGRTIPVRDVPDVESRISFPRPVQVEPYPAAGRLGARTRLSR